MRTSTLSASKEEPSMTFVPISSVLILLSSLMIRGRRSAHVSFGVSNFRPCNPKKPAVAPLRRFCGVSKTAWTRTGIVIGVANGPLIVVCIERETEGIDLIAVSEHAHHDLVAAPSLMLMRRIVVRLLPNARRTIVSPAWPKRCCLTVDLRTVIVISGSVTAKGNVKGTETVIANATDRENGTETETGNGIETEIETENGTVIGIGIGITARDHDVTMMPRVTTTERDGIVKKNERGSTAVGLNAVLLRNFPTAMSALLRPAVVESKMKKIVVILEIQR